MPEQIPVHPETITTQNGEYQLRVNSRGAGNMCFEISLFDASDSAHPPRAIASTSIVHEGSTVIIGGSGVDFVQPDLRGNAIGKALWKAALHVAHDRFRHVTTVGLEVAEGQKLEDLFARFNSYEMPSVTQYLKSNETAIHKEAMEDERTVSSRDVMTRTLVVIPLALFQAALN